jgi:O-succinylbenzoic acid--CoA ligase
MERADLIRLLGSPSAVAEMRDVIVEERDPSLFIASFADAVAAGGTVFLADPAWGAGERAQFSAWVSLRPSTTGLRSQDSGLSAPSSDLGWLCIPTGGSSGNLKLARHDEKTIAAAVQGFCAHFGVAKVNAVGLLPLNHVSGFMAWMRTVLTGGTYLPWNWKAVEAGERPVLPAGQGEWFLSLVPTQLQRLLGDAGAEDWLRGFRAVFVGGGPAWPELVEAGAEAGLPLAFSYGMTETAAMVAALRPEEFLAGMRGSGTVLPHATVVVGAEGRLAIESTSFFRGYWPEARPAGPWLTDDLGHVDEQGCLHVTGRCDALIVTGGEKVDPTEVEAALRATRQFGDVAVIGMPDSQWGECVVACYPEEFGPGDLPAVMRALATRLAGFKHPKRYIAIDRWPRNAQGKVNRAELRRIVDRKT